MLQTLVIRRCSALPLVPLLRSSVCRSSILRGCRDAGLLEEGGEDGLRLETTVLHDGLNSVVRLNVVRSTLFSCNSAHFLYYIKG